MIPTGKSRNNLCFYIDLLLFYFHNTSGMADGPLNIIYIYTYIYMGLCTLYVLLHVCMYIYPPARSILWT